MAVWFIILCEFAGLIGSLFTVSAIPTWYAALNKPFFSPPNYLFGPVWTILYIMMGLAAFFVYQKGWQKKKVRIALYTFGVQLALNTLWSIIFFGLRSPLGGFIEIIVLWSAIFVTIWRFATIDMKAALLMVPYILWVTFALMLNFAIVLLNT